MTPVIFDLDGTLADTLPDIAHAAHVALEPEGARALSADEVRSFVGRGADAFLADAMAATDVPAHRKDTVRTRFDAAYGTALHLTALYPGVLAALDALTAAGHPLGICTNKPTGPTNAVLSHFDLAARFAAVVAGDTLAVKKPDPEPLRETMRRMRTESCIYVGDSETDAATALATGLPFLLFTCGYRRTTADEIAATHRFDHWDALPGLIRGLE